MAATTILWFTYFVRTRTGSSLLAMSSKPFFTRPLHVLLGPNQLAHRLTLLNWQFTLDQVHLSSLAWLGRRCSTHGHVVCGCLLRGPSLNATLGCQRRRWQGFAFPGGWSAARVETANAHRQCQRSELVAQKISDSLLSFSFVSDLRCSHGANVDPESTFASPTEQTNTMMVRVSLLAVAAMAFLIVTISAAGSAAGSAAYKAMPHSRAKTSKSQLHQRRRSPPQRGRKNRPPARLHGPWSRAKQRGLEDNTGQILRKTNVSPTAIPECEVSQVSCSVNGLGLPTNLLFESRFRCGSDGTSVILL